MENGRADFENLREEINSVISNVSDIVSVVQPSGLSLVLSYQLMESRVKTLNGDIGDYEQTHQNDTQNMDSMIESIRSILIARTGSPAISVTNYQAGSIAMLPAYQRLQTGYEASGNYVAKNMAQYEDAIKKFEDKMNDKLADDRKVEGFKQFLAGIVSVTVGTALILATAGTAAPIVFFSATVVGGTSTLYGLSNATEGMNNISLGFSGDGFTMAENPIRDTLFAGNPDLYYVKLNEDMISCDGEVVHEQMTHEAFGERKGNQKRPTLYEEGPWAYKRKNKYYMAFASTCCPEGMGYSMSDSPTGPWVYKGMIMEGDRRSNGNHPGIIDYKGNTYVFGFNYDIHFSKISQHYERRSICVEKLTFNPDGTIQQLPFWTAKGVDPVGKLDPYRRVEAETIAWSEGLKTEKSEAGMYVTAIHDGDYIRVRNVDFKKGAKSFEAVAASSSSGGQIEIRLDDKEGTLIGTCVIGNTGGPESWKTFQAQVDKVKGVHDVYFIFRGGEDELFNFDCWKFIR